MTTRCKYTWSENMIRELKFVNETRKEGRHSVTHAKVYVKIHTCRNVKLYMYMLFLF